MSSITIGQAFCVGDDCWIEAIESYQGRRYRPQLIIGSFVSISSWTHVSCASRIVVGDGCLIGSKVYIGDHRHGIYSKDGGGENAGGLPFAFPGEMPLADLADIEIGEGTWIGDGAVILGGTRIAGGSVIGANSVVRVQESRSALIAGVPARVLQHFDRGS